MLLIVTFGTGRAPSALSTATLDRRFSQGVPISRFQSRQAFKKSVSSSLEPRTRSGVLISSSALAVYQVLERDDLPHLQPRDESGGGGRYLLQIVLFDTAQGKSLGTIRLATSGVEPSGVYPTHDGSFVVKTGRQPAVIFFKAGADCLQAVAAVGLGFRPQAPIISVSPSGQQVYVAYRPSAERDVLDADTLELLPNSQQGDWDAEANPKALNFVAKDTSCPVGLRKADSDVLCVIWLQRAKDHLL